MLSSTSVAPAPTAPLTPQRETVLRLAAALLPGNLLYRTAPMPALADQLADLRRLWNFDVETAFSIDSWLRLYRGEG